MSDRKIIHELSDADLIALASGADPEEVVEKISEAAKFIFDCKIKHGSEPIPAALIYHTYQCWKGWDQKKQSKPMFFRDFSKYFPPGRGLNGRVYLLNPKPFDLSEETRWLYRKEQREARAQRNKKAKTK
jgi:hypothetical protein